MTIRHLVLAAAITAGFAIPVAQAKMPGHASGTLRERAEQACYGDATRLCNEFIPDEAKITACMGEKKAQLSPECRKIYDKGL